MKQNQKLIISLVASAVLLMAGTINYFLFQPHILLFNWLQIQPAFFKINNNFAVLFFKGYFSDILWCIALCLTVSAFNSKFKITYFDKCILLSIPFLSEFAQLFKLMPGTFDWMDIIIYAAIIFLFNNQYLIPLKMQEFKKHGYTLGIFVIFLFMAYASSAPRQVFTPNVPANKINTIQKNDAEEASIKTDQANVDFSVEVNKKYDLLQAWKLSTQIVTDYFDDIEVSDRETSYLRTAWSIKSFQQTTVRTRLIIKLGNSDPLTFKIKLVSEYSKYPGASVKSDEQFIEWDRILRRYQNIIGDFSARLGNK